MYVSFEIGKSNSNFIYHFINLHHSFKVKCKRSININWKIRVSCNTAKVVLGCWKQDATNVGKHHCPWLSKVLNNIEPESACNHVWQLMLNNIVDNEDNVALTTLHYIMFSTTYNVQPCSVSPWGLECVTRRYIKVKSILLECLGTIFAYGQTGTGKTFTMEGKWWNHRNRVRHEYLVGKLLINDVLLCQAVWLCINNTRKTTINPQQLATCGKSVNKFATTYWQLGTRCLWWCSYINIIVASQASFSPEYIASR